MAAILMEENEEGRLRNKILSKNRVLFSYESFLLFHQSNLAEEHNIEHRQH